MCKKTSTSSSSVSFTDELRTLAGDQWERIIKHKFTIELAKNTIDKQTVLKKYLIQDHRFVDGFVILLASIISHLPTLKDRIPGCQFLGLITSRENTYFERSYDKLNISEEERNATPDHPCTTKFINHMISTARNGTLGEMLAIIVVCEWSYLSWGQNVLNNGLVVRNDKDDENNNFECYEWVDLHSGPYFESVVSYFRNCLDQEAKNWTKNDEEKKQKCINKFLETVQLEEEFFNSVYE